MGVVSVVVVLLIAVGVVLAIALSSAPKNNATVGRQPLRVDPRGDGKAAFATIRDAVRQAGPGDHIVLIGDVTEPPIQIAQGEPGHRVGAGTEGGLAVFRQGRGKDVAGR